MKPSPFILISLITVFSPALSFGSNLPKASIQTRVIELKPLSDILSYPAIARAKAEATLSSEADGIVTKIFVKLGESVQKGKVIMLIERVDPVYKYTPFKVLAPLAGQVSKLEHSEGSQVSRGQALVQIMDISQIKLIAEVPGRDLPHLKPGMNGAWFENQSMSVAKTHALTLHQMTPSIDDLTGTAKLELLPENTPNAPAILPGQIVRVQFEVNTRNAVSIPDHSISYKGSAPFVRLLQTVEGKTLAKQTLVTLGRKTNGMVEVLDGLKHDDVLIERSSRYLSDGEAVETQTPSK
jgi:multidrug efflux pump subunit AcrA (membrane-fusion protein)